jgi:hypothetical protein
MQFGHDNKHELILGAQKDGRHVAAATLLTGQLSLDERTFAGAHPAFAGEGLGEGECATVSLSVPP